MKVSFLKFDFENIIKWNNEITFIKNEINSN